MIKVVFVCHGNICRSPMAEFMFQDMVERRGVASEFYIRSAATSREEIGNPVHYRTQEKLAEIGISTDGKRAVQLTKKDCKEYDYILGMDSYNIRNIEKIAGGPMEKIGRLLDFTEEPRDIADPWYTGNFDRTFADIKEGLEAFLAYLESCAK